MGPSLRRPFSQPWGGKCRIRADWPLDLPAATAAAQAHLLMAPTAIPAPEVFGSPDLQPKNKKTYYLYELDVPAGGEQKIQAI
ncbi:MAG: hypothetical protein ACK5JD_04765 [Mangrovibacterium sp.]